MIEHADLTTLIQDLDLVNPVETASLEETVWTAVRRMRSHNSGTLVVSTTDGQPLGIVTDRDIVLRLVATGLDPEQTTVERIMTRSPVTLRAGATISDALGAMAERGVRRMPIVNSENRLTGIITLDDIVRELCADHAEIDAILRWATPTPPALTL